MNRYVFSISGILAALLVCSAITAPQGYIVGDVADNFTLKNVNDSLISLDSYPHAKGYIIIFTCNHCPYAQAYENRIIDLHKKFNDKGFPVIAINPNSPEITPEDSFEEMKKRAKDKKYPFVYLFDEDQTVFPKFGATRTPHVFLLDKELTVQYIGAIDDNPEHPTAVRQKYVENAVNALLRGETPKPSYTRAVGCTVKKKPVPSEITDKK